MIQDTIDRRRFVGSAVSGAIALTAGCLGEEVSGGFSPDEDGSDESQDGDDDGAAELSEGAAAVRDSFESRDVDVQAVSEDDEAIVVEIQTTGSISEDIQTAAGAYATVVDSVDRDLRVRIEDRGMAQESFLIEREWAEQFVNDRMGDQEFVDRINETRSNR